MTLFKIIFSYTNSYTNNLILLLFKISIAGSKYIKMLIFVISIALWESMHLHT